MIACPDRAELEHYLAASLPPGRLGEVDSHVSNCRSCSDFLERLSRDALQALPCANLAAFPVSPEAVAGYELQEKLGSGGMGVVWKAKQSSLNRLVALKFLGSRSLVGDELWERFQVEAEAAARLKHPNVVGIYEFGVSASGPYLAMELVEGGTLAAALAAGPWPADGAAAFLECVARAVHYAHLKGVLHRDLKPANILLANDGTPKIADFGLAKRLDSDAGQTRTGQRMGTPAYMSPEQAAGKPVGVATDVYALGSILYHLLAGRPPFVEETVDAVLDQVQTRDPIPLRRLRPKLPRDLETICLRCLLKEPERRLESCQELADELQRFLGGEPIRSRPVGAVERGFRWAQRKPALAGLYTATLAAALLLGFGVVIALFWRQAAESRDRMADALVATETARKDAEEERKRAQKAAVSERAAKETEAFLREELSRVDYGRTIKLAQLLWHARQIDAAGIVLDECRKDLRGWEWWYLSRLCHPEILNLKHTTVTAPAVSSDGKWIAAGCEDEGEPRIRIWNAASGAEVAVFTLAPLMRKGGIPVLEMAHDLMLGIADVAFTVDGSHVIVRRGQFIQLWDWSTGKKSAQYSTADQVLAVSALGRGNACVAVRSSQEKVIIRDIVLDQPVATLQMTGEEIAHVNLSADGAWAVTAGTTPGGTRIRIWNVSTGKSNIIVDEQQTNPNDMVWSLSPDGSRIATRRQPDRPDAKGKPIIITDIRSLIQTASLEWPAQRIETMSVGPQGEEIVIGVGNTAEPGRTEIWSVREKRRLNTLQPNLGTAVFAPNRRWIASGNIGPGAFGGRPVRTWPVEMDEGRELKSLSPGAVAFAANGSQVILGPRDTSNELQVVDSRSGAAIRNVRYEVPRAVSELAASRDGRWFAAAIETGDVRVWNAKTGEVVLDLDGPGGHARLAFDWDGNRLAITHGTRITIWSLLSNTRMFAIESQQTEYSSAAFTPDGATLVVAANGWVERRDAKNGNILHKFRAHGAVIYALVVSSDGETVVTAGDGDSVKVWALKDGTEELALRRPDVNGIAISPDGKRITTASNDTMRIWDAHTGAELLRFDTPGLQPHFVVFSADGWRIAMAGQWGNTRVWDATPIGQAFVPQAAQKPGGRP